MMASAEPPSSFSIVPLLECLEDSAAGRPEQTDAYLTIANRLSGEDGRQFLPAVTKHFSRLGNALLSHVSSPHAELSQAALQALGFCVYHSHVVSGVSETFTTEILSALCSLVSKSTEKNTCTRALWVISKQNFPANMVGKKVPSILSTLESIRNKGEVQSVVMEHEALNVVIRLLEQVPAQMGEWAVCWAKLVIPLVVHSASKVRLRAAAAMELGLPLLLQKQMEVAAIVEPLMSTKLIPELQKLFMSKNEMNVLKLWPLFVKLLGKLLHRGGPFINSLLHLEELGFRSSSPTIKKIAFIAWKSLIDNFALNPDILCSAKRMKLLMQPLMSINIRTEALMLTKVEVWWYLVVQLGPNLSSHFDLVSLPLLQYTIGSEATSTPATPARGQNGVAANSTPKSGGPQGFNSLTPSASRLSLNSSMQLSSPSIKLLGLEMLLHYFLGPEVLTTATKSKLILTLEPLRHPFLSATSSFSKHAAVLISSIKDGFNVAGKDAPDALLTLLWDHLIHYVTLTIESGGKKDRNGCEVLTLVLQALQNIVCSEALPADKVLILFESTIKGISPRILGSASYQVGKMDVLNGTPALFLILLFFDSNMLDAYVEDARFYQCLQTLVDCSLSGPTSPLAFAEAVLSAIGRIASSMQSKEHMLRIWSVLVTPLTDTITQSNEVNQGDALEHNFSAMHSALMFPITHLLSGLPQQQAAQKSMLSTWTKLYKVFARCSALVVTAEENICCEELCVKMAATLDREALTVTSTLTAFACILQVMVECVDFSPYMPQFQQKLKSPHTPVNWTRKKNKALGNLSTFQSLLVQCLDIYLSGEDVPSETTGMALLSVMSTLFTNLMLANAVTEALTALIQHLVGLYKQATCDPPRFTPQILAKMEKLLGEVFVCIQSRAMLASDTDLLALLSPFLCVLFTHKNKQHRTAVTHFWNSTFANAVSLIYPDELRPVLSQVKQKTPIILPGFETVTVADELSGPYSSESSQTETKLSGVPFTPTGQRDPVHVESVELSDRSTPRTSKPVSTKLDFGSPKIPRRKVLDEESSVDFVFIPPETKERVLTEHQKEVKRTKRVDIPAMYNNLDASLDTTVFTQYTQSQEDSQSKSPTEDADKVATDISAEGKKHATNEDIPQETNEGADIHQEETQDFASPTSLENESTKEDQEIITQSTSVSVEEDARSSGRIEEKDMQNEKYTSPNTPSSSDLVSGTPQKSSGGTRRQSFITLEKYIEGKPASPSTATLFTGPLMNTSGSPNLMTPSPEASQSHNVHDSQLSSQALSKCPLSGLQESPRRPKIDSGMKVEPVRLAERLTSKETEFDDIIPDTQTENMVMENTTVTSTSDDMRSSDPDGDSQQTGEESQSLTSPGERRIRKHAKHQLPEESPVDSSTPHNRPNTRSKVASEQDSGRIQLRSRRDGTNSSQTKSQVLSHRKVKLYTSSKNFLPEAENKRRRPRSQDSSQNDLLPESESLSQPKRRKSLPDSEEKLIKPKKALGQTDLKSESQSDSESQSQRGHSKSLLATKVKCLKKPKPVSETVSSQCELQSLCRSPSGLESQSRRKHGRPPKSYLHSKEEVLQGPGQSEKLSSHMGTYPDPQSDSESNSQGNVSRSENCFQDPKGGDLKPDSMSKKLSIQTDSSQSETLANSVNQSQQESEGQHDLPDQSSLQPNEEDSMNPEISTKVSGDIDLQSDTNCDTESQTQKRSRTNETGEVLKLQQFSSQTNSLLDIGSNSQSQTQQKCGKPSPKLKQILKESNSQSQFFSEPIESSKTVLDEELEQTGKGENKAGFHVAIVSTKTDSLEEKKTENDSPIIASLTSDTIQEGISIPTCILSNRELTKDEPETELSQGSLEIISTSTDSPLLPRSRRSKASSEVGKSEASAASKKQTRSHSQENSPAEVREGQRRRSKIHEKRSSSTTSPESLQSLDAAASTDSSQGRRLRSSKVFTASIDSLESESSEAKEKCPLPAKRRKSQGNSEKLEPIQVQEDSPESQDPSGSEPLATSDTYKDSQMDVPVVKVLEPVEEKPEPEKPKIGKKQVSLSSSPSTRKGRQRISRAKAKSATSQESEPGDLESSETLESEGKATEQNQECFSEDVALDAQIPSEEAKKKLQVSESSSEEPNFATEMSAEGQKQEECSSIVDEVLKAAQCSVANTEKTSHQVLEDFTTVHECGNGEEMPSRENQEDPTHISNPENKPEAAQSDVCTAGSTMSTLYQDSPAKLKDLEAELMPDLAQSPCGNRTKGTWSPSSSPSTSILKKGQKRPVDEETPSPLIKSRRVSFANPIQQQETADDIDRRSPAVRMSSPRRAKVCNLSQPKSVTTPTKGGLTLSPRNLHHPNFKSSKKCLISEMSREPRPASKNCIYPALVGCAAPVEAVLPQISSNIWSRGFGQLVRARNIKTVGDLSALTPNEVKTLPIHSPKISNVKKALQSYEQQRKARGVDELKGFVEMEMMTSEPEETSTTLNQDEEEKPTDMLATELTDELSPAKLKEEQPEGAINSSEPGAPEGPSEGPKHLLTQLDALDYVVTPSHLSGCSPQQLFQVHEHLTLLMRRVMVEMRSRLAPVDKIP